MAKRERKNNDSQNIIQQIKDRATRTPLKCGCELRCSGGVGSSCSTCGTTLLLLQTRNFDSMILFCFSFYWLDLNCFPTIWKSIFHDWVSCMKHYALNLSQNVVLPSVFFYCCSCCPMFWYIIYLWSAEGNKQQKLDVMIRATEVTVIIQMNKSEYTCTYNWQQYSVH